MQETSINIATQNGQGPMPESARRQGSVQASPHVRAKAAVGLRNRAFVACVVRHVTR